MPTPDPGLALIAPQFLVDDLDRSIAYYRDRLGFEFGEPFQGFYAIGRRDGVELHLKEAPKLEADRKHRRDNDHLDAYVRVNAIEDFYRRCVAAGVTILLPLATKPWGMTEFYAGDPDGYIICFGGE